MSIPTPYSRGMRAAMAEVKKLPGLPYMGTVEAIVEATIRSAVAEIESEPVKRTDEHGPAYWNGFEDGMDRAADIVRGET